MVLPILRVRAALTMSTLSDYPLRLCASTEHPEVIYIRAKGYHAVKGDSDTVTRHAKLTLEDGDGTYAVMEGEPGSLRNNISAVYMGSGGLMFVPTGRVFVRLRDDALLEAHAEAFRRLGYVITQTLPYAPNAGWLEHVNKDAAEALRGIPDLARLPGVQNVEPQLLTVRAQR